MAYPVVPIKRSSLLNGQTNGRLTSDIMLNTPGQAGGPVVRLVKPAARAWRAMAAAALLEGHVLKATSLVDSYRPYDVQERIFLQRFTTTNNGSSVRRFWRGQWWYLRPGFALAAVPGTSNHGWAQAVDTGEEKDGDTGTESLDNATLGWLLANEERFGWSHEVQSERWHLRYFAGDNIPQAVLDYESSVSPAPPTPAPSPSPKEEDNMNIPAVIIKSDDPADEGRWYVTDTITRQWIMNRSHAAILISQGAAKAQAGTGDQNRTAEIVPFTWPGIAVASIRLVE